ncbi:MAG: hypothetical protein AB8H79_20310 [Myxococcota bacterium]
MKIRPTQPHQRVSAAERDPRRRTAGSQRNVTTEPATQVRRSPLMAALGDAEPASIRHDLVNEVRAQLAAGTFEASVDIDAAIDSLLGDL